MIYKSHTLDMFLFSIGFMAVLGIMVGLFILVRRYEEAQIFKEQREKQEELRQKAEHDKITNDRANDSDTISTKHL